jgi:hypothetical protein
MNENAWLGVTNHRGKGVVSMYHGTPSGQKKRDRNRNGNGNGNRNGNRGGIRGRSERGSRSGNRSDFKDKKQSNSC